MKKKFLFFSALLCKVTIIFPTDFTYTLKNNSKKTVSMFILTSYIGDRIAPCRACDKALPNTVLSLPINTNYILKVMIIVGNKYKELFIRDHTPYIFSYEEDSTIRVEATQQRTIE